jgi:NAD(P)H-hydrate epimerase
MILLNSAQSREMERLAIEEIGIPEEALMESAGQSVVIAMEREWGSLTGRQVAVLCGKGRNGADGMVAARHLINEGATVVALIAAKEEELSAPARRQSEILRRLGLSIAFIKEGPEGLAFAKALFQRANIVIDALYGTGFKGAVTGHAAALLITLNGLGKPVVSVDLPSGLDANTGLVAGACAYASLTVTFGYPKLGSALYPGKSFCGKLIQADIGLPMMLAARIKGPFAELSEPGLMKALLPQRALNAHKKNAGTLLVVAGSKQYAGAAVLACKAALGGGAGFVHLLVPEEMRVQMQSSLPEVVVQTRGLDKALEVAKQCHAAVVGPGLGEEAAGISSQLYEKLALPAVFDADALSYLSPAKPAFERLLTPHEGELQKIKPGALDSEARPGAALALAAERGAAVLLKGPSTLVASPSGALAVNGSGSQALATAGSGDVLAGLCGALMAQGLGAFDAGRLGAYLHGLAADLRTAQKGSVGLTAGELADNLPSAFFQLREKA